MKKLILTTYGDEKTKISNKVKKYAMKAVTAAYNQKTIIAFVDFGCKDGTRKACYKVLKGLDNAFNLFSAQNGEWYIDDNNLKSIQTYSGGINYITFREVNDESKVREICGMQLDGTLTGKKLSSMTKSLKPIIEELIQNGGI